jgi:hypothetical protein
MFKRILFLIVLFVDVMTLKAQKPFTPTTHLGITGGVNISRVAFTPTVKQNPMTSATMGLVVRHVSEPHIGLQMELNFAGEGWSEDADTLGSYKRKLQVLNLPMQAVFIAGSKMLRFAFTIGPYITWIKDEKESIAMDTAFYGTYYEQPLPAKWEFGFTGGLGVEFHTKIGAFGIRAIYSNALTNLFPLNASTFYFNGSRSQILQAGFTYYHKL